MSAVLDIVLNLGGAASTNPSAQIQKLNGGKELVEVGCRDKKEFEVGCSRFWKLKGFPEVLDFRVVNL